MTLVSEAFEARPPCAVAVWNNRCFEAEAVIRGRQARGAGSADTRRGVCWVSLLLQLPPFGALVARSADTVQGVSKGRSSSCSTNVCPHGAL